MNLLRPTLLCFALHSAGAMSATPYIEREDVRLFMQEMVERHGFTPQEIEQTMAMAQETPRVIELIKPPENPGVRSWQRYRARFIDPTRIRAGLQFWNTHATTLEAAETRYGVPAHIIVGIIGVETIYGRNTGSFNTLSALTTLAFDYPPRAPLFRGELESLFLLARLQGRHPINYKGSFAGALGLPQFLPSSVLRHAVDFDDNGVIELTASPADAIGSVARYLADYGWQKDGRVTLRARLTDTADIAAASTNDLRPAFNAEELAARGVSTATDSLADGETASLIEFVTPGQASEYWLGLQNFYVITRYNRSSFYAMAVYDLAEAVRLARRDGLPQQSAQTTKKTNKR